MTVATSWALVAAAILIVAAVLHIWQLTAVRRRPPVGPCRAAPVDGGRPGEWAVVDATGRIVDTADLRDTPDPHRWAWARATALTDLPTALDDRQLGRLLDRHPRGAA